MNPDAWLHAVMDDQRLTGSALKYAWYAYKRAKTNTPIIRWQFGQTDKDRMTAFRGADVLERLGYLHKGKKANRVALHALAMPRTTKSRDEPHNSSHERSSAVHP